jgi:hypothetical protein
MEGELEKERIKKVKSREERRKRNEVKRVRARSGGSHDVKREGEGEIEGEIVEGGGYSGIVNDQLMVVDSPEGDQGYVEIDRKEGGGGEGKGVEESEGRDGGKIGGVETEEEEQEGIEKGVVRESVTVPLKVRCILTLCGTVFPLLSLI